MFAAFHIPDLAIAAALLERPEQRDHPCGLLREASGRDDGKIPLLALNEAARGTGVMPGWQLNRALVRCPDLVVIDRQPKNEECLLTEMLEFAECFTPDVERSSADTVLLDLSTAPASTIDDLAASVCDRRLEFHRRSQTAATVVYALAHTPDLAHFAALEPSTRNRRVTVEDIDALPLALLERLDETAACVPLLALLGLRTLGDFRKLPRQELIERFGSVAGRWHDLVSGKTCRLLKLHRPPESLLQSVDFDDPVHSAEALLFLFNRLLHALAARLAARHLAVGALHIHLQLEQGELRRDIHLPEPLSDPAALLQPIQTFIESLKLPSPVTGVRFDASTAFPLSRQNDWTGRRLPHPERWADTLARLEALLGPDRIGIPKPLDLHQPDAFELRDPTAGTNEPLSNRPPLCSIPLRRFRPPLKIAVAFDPKVQRELRPLALLSGPHCGEVLDQRGPFFTSGHHWDPALSWKRLEWDIQVAGAPLLRLVWLPGNQWQLDGIYG